jgi:hypothetical protein
MHPSEAPASRRAPRVGALVWLLWLSAAVALTLKPFLWHVDYFQHPGRQFYLLFLAAMAAAAAAVPVYQRIRRGGLWRYELALLTGLPVAAFLFYEPRATLVTAWVFVTCYATGRFLRKRLGLEPGGFVEDVSLSAGIGFGALLCALFVMGMCRWYYPGAFMLLLAAADLISFREIRGLWPALRGLHRSWGATTEIGGWTGVLLAGFAACFILCSTMVILSPSLAFDVLLNHLPAAEYYAAQHSLDPLPLQIYPYLPQGGEVLMTLGYSLGGQAAAQMAPPVFFVLALLMGFLVSRACGADRFSAVAGIGFAASIPFLHWTGSVAKNDLILAFFVLAALYCWLRWKDSGRFVWIQLGVFFLASGAGVKYTALFGFASLAPLYLYAAWRQPRRLRATASLAAIIVVFGLLWQARAFILTGNPLYPKNVHEAVLGLDDRPPQDWKALALRYARMPWTLHFVGARHFESPSPNPLGIFFVLFWPAWLLARRTRWNANAWACVLFCGLYLLYWARLVDWPRYAIAPFMVLASLTAWRLMEFYRGSAQVVRASINAATAYCLVFALLVTMIAEINAPQFRLFARQTGKAGYLRKALSTIGPLEFLRSRGIGHDLVLAVDNCSAAYAPDPARFACVSSGGDIRPGVLAAEHLERGEYRWLILPVGPMGLSGRQELASRVPVHEVYHDRNFAVFRVEQR